MGTKQKEPEVNDDWITVSELSNQIGISEGIINRAIRRRILVCHRFVRGGRRFIHKDDLSAWIEKSRQRGAE